VPVPSVSSVAVAARVKPVDADQLTFLAAREETTVSAVIAKLVADALAKTK
jgi:hypothetical protein